MVLQDAIHNLIELVCVLRPVNDTTVFLGFRRELVKILVEVGDGVALDGTGLLAQFFPLLKSVCHIVTFCANSPECGIMPSGVCLVL